VIDKMETKKGKNNIKNCSELLSLTLVKETMQLYRANGRCRSLHSCCGTVKPVIWFAERCMWHFFKGFVKGIAGTGTK
jgi:hypothetical protein